MAIKTFAVAQYAHTTGITVGTSGSTVNSVTMPSDFVFLIAAIAIGAGKSGGGAYAIQPTIAGLSANGSVSLSLGVANGTQGNTVFPGTADTWVSSSGTLYAQGANPNTTAAGQASNCWPTTGANSGGTGYANGGGGGAGGPHGPGSAGAYNSGGAGDANYGGYGGYQGSAGANGSNGTKQHPDAGPGGTGGTGGPGGSGSEWTDFNGATWGCGGGGGPGGSGGSPGTPFPGGSHAGSGSTGNGGQGGSYGGGAGLYGAAGAGAVIFIYSNTAHASAGGGGSVIG